MALKKGTTLPDTEVRFIDCAHAPHCGHSAIIREKTPTGWANLCIEHYLEHIERDRMARWKADGSPSAADSIAKIKRINSTPKPSGRQHWERVLKTPGAPHSAIEYARFTLKRWEREPGSDDE